MSVIKIVNLKKYYGHNRGVENLNLEIKEGEIFGFIGPNGAGKSTTIRTLLGFIKPTSGEVFINGKACTDNNLAQLKQDIGYLPSEVDYYDNLRVGQLLRYSGKFYKKNCEMKINELCEYFDLDQKRAIDELSYGNKKKVAIIQSLIHEPKLLILDEPTGGLDPLMQNKFFNLLKKVNEKGTTVFFSSHILFEIQKLCDRVAIIKDGEIIKLESIEDLKSTMHKKVRIILKEGAQFDINSSHIQDLKQVNREVTFLYSGKVTHLLDHLNNIEIDNFWVSEPDLEEVFMHYYGKGGK